MRLARRIAIVRVVRGAATGLDLEHDPCSGWATTLSRNGAHGVSPGQAAAIDCRVGCGFASRKLRHSPARSAEMKKLLPPVALSRITIPCSDVRVITTSPTHGSARTSGEASIASLVVEEVDEVDGGEDDSPLWPRQPVKTQVEKIATTGGKIDFSAAPLPRITRPRILLSRGWLKGECLHTRPAERGPAFTRAPERERLRGPMRLRSHARFPRRP
jgi:hypothetical protein